MKKTTPVNTAFTAFAITAGEYTTRVEAEKQAEEAQTKSNQCSLRSDRTRTEQMFKWLIERATENFRKQLSSNNPCLLLYFTSLFKDRGYSFTDTSGVSGFPLPPSKMQVIKGTKKDQEIIPGLQGTVRRITNFGHRPSVSVHALNIYYGAKDQSSQDSKLPTIALIVKHDGVGSNFITQKHLANCRVALLGGSHLDTPPIKPELCFPSNQDYMFKLVELCAPETMFEQVFRYHGPAKLD